MPESKKTVKSSLKSVALAVPKNKVTNGVVWRPVSHGVSPKGVFKHKSNHPLKKTWFKVVLITSFYYSTLGIRKYASATSWKGQPLLNTRQYVSSTSRRCCSHLGTSCDDSLMYQVDQSQGAIWYVAATSRIGQFYLSTS